MKIKYRLMIIFIILFTMGMGMITFSVGVNDVETTKVLTDEEIESAKTAPLVKNDNKEVENLVENYIDAKLNGDVDKLALYVTDGTDISKDELDVPTTYMEGYETIDCYVIDIPIKDNYVVYVYKEYKMKGIETVFPSLVRHYICPDDKGNLVIYSGTVEASVVKFINNTKENPEVVSLINMVDNKVEQIKEEDPVAKAFLDKLDEVVTEGEEDKQPEGEKPQESKKPESSDETKEDEKSESGDESKEDEKSESDESKEDEKSESGEPKESKKPQTSDEPKESEKPETSEKPQASEEAA